MKKIFLLVIVSLYCNLFAKEVKIEVKKMHCPLCTTMIKKVIKKVDGVQTVKVLLNTKIATVNYDESKTTIDEILKAIKTTSYSGVVVSDN